MYYADCEKGAIEHEIPLTRPVVLHLVTSLDFGGVERHMECIAREQNEARMRHVFCALGAGGRTANKLMQSGIEVTCLKTRFRIPSRTALWALVRYLLVLKPSALHCHGAEANFHGLLAAKLTGVSVRVGEEIGIPNHGRLARWVFRMIYQQADQVIAISNAVARWLTASGEVDADRVVCLHNPVLLPKLASHDNKCSTVLQIGFVGRLEPVKNPLVLIEALRLLDDRGVRAELWLIGDGSLRALMEKAIRDNGVEGRVHLPGYQDNPAEWIKHCHIYAQPSLSEGFGLAMVEAMAVGMPVIATATGGAAEIIQPGVTGWIIDDCDARAVADTLEKAWLMGPGELNSMGKQARLSVLERFDPHTYLQSLETLYQVIARQKGRYESAGVLPQD